MRFNEQNMKGGINGRPIRFIAFDDGFSPPIARQNMEKLIYEIKTNLIIFPVGSPTLEASLDLIKNQKAYILFPQSGSPLFRQPDLKSLINFRESNENEGYALTRYIVENKNVRKIALFFQDNAFGRGALGGSVKALKEAGIKDWLEVPHEANATDFTRQAKAIADYEPDAIGFWTTGPPVISLINALGISSLIGKHLFAISSAGDNRSMQIYKSRGLDMHVSRLVPNPETSQLKIVQEYRDHLRRYGYIPNQFSLEAYIVASITIDILSRIKGKITIDKINNILKKYKNTQFKGLTLTYNPDNRSLANYLWIDTGSAEWVKQSIDR
jgi:ABC-type branched-subunit amino acid transport system substrate-binding protein